MARVDGLGARGVGVSFGGLRALNDVDLDLGLGEILGLIGPNGAGKTTLLNVLSGHLRIQSGRIVLEGRDVSGWAPHRRSRHGLGRTFQDIRIFKELSVRENVEVAALQMPGSGNERRRRVTSMLEMLRLIHLSDRRAGDIPHGEARRLGIARGLGAGARYLLMDEPAAGLNDIETEEVMGSLRDLVRELGCGVLVVEHDMRFVMQLCQRIHVLVSGMTIASGPPDAVGRDPKVIAAYLGVRS